MERRDFHDPAADVFAFDNGFRSTGVEFHGPSPRGLSGADQESPSAERLHHNRVDPGAEAKVMGRSLFHAIDCG